MATADQFVKEIFSWITQGEDYADKLKKLAERLESERVQANAVKCIGASTAVMGSAVLIGVGAASVLTGGLATPLLVAGAAYTGVGASACVGASITEEKNSMKILKEARDILNRSNEIVSRIQELFEKLKKEKKRQNSMLDPEELDNHVLADVLMAVGRHRGQDMSNMGHLLINQIKFSFTNGGNMYGAHGPQLVFLHVLASVFAVLLMFNLNVGSKHLGLKVGFEAVLSGGIMLAGAGAMVYFLPEAIDSWRDLIKNNYLTEASRSLRSRAEEILKITRELREHFNTIEEFLRKISRIKFILEKEIRTKDEKRALIDYAIDNTPYPEVKQWLRENSESDVFCHLVDLKRFIRTKLDEEEEEKKKKDRKRKKIELIFLAHGSIKNQMIPARCLMPLPPIKDVLLYSPWNCRLTAGAAYSIAKGTIQPDHRQFVCSKPEECNFPPTAHASFTLPYTWNSMSNTTLPHVPNIMVSPVAIKDDKAFAAFTSLAEIFGVPEGNRFLIPFLATEIGRVPFSVVMLAISLVLSFSCHVMLFLDPDCDCEVTVHLAACLGKSPGDAKMQEEYLRQQYAYTVDYTRMKVPKETFSRDEAVYDMFRAVFGDDPPSS